MFSPLRNRFGIPGVISVIALVFALAGGAYAADSGDGATASANKKNRKGKQGGLNAKQKRQVRNISANIAKRFQGTGPVGPQGVPGLPGAPGPKGDDGDDGSDGSDGKSVLIDSFDEVSEPEGEPCNEFGGSEFEVEGSGNAHILCNGTEGPAGSPWSDGGTLPVGATETGTWSAPVIPFEESSLGALIPISFPVPLANPLGTGDVVIMQEGEGETPNCPGTAENPDAAEGKLCVYVGGSQEVIESEPLPSVSLVVVDPSKPFQKTNTAARSGAMLQWEQPPFSLAYGTWAVTAPEA